MAEPLVGKQQVRYVVVSRYSPWPDGIANYAQQLVDREAAVRSVQRIGLPGSSVERVLRLDGGLRPLRLLGSTRRTDEVALMWHPSYYITGRIWNRVGGYLALGVVLRRRNCAVHVHEPDGALARRTGIRRVATRIERGAQRWFWTSPATFVFHSRWQRDELARRLPETADHVPVLIIDHSTVYRPRVSVSPLAARRSLGLPPGSPLLLCIGFFGRHKGYDRAMRAFLRLHAAAAHLYVVGSIPREWPADATRFLHELYALAQDSKSISIVNRYVEDEEFDRWIMAADAVLLPYREASSSAVAARARLLGTPVVATAVGGLPEQVSEQDVLVESDDELEAAIARFAFPAPSRAVVG